MCHILIDKSIYHAKPRFIELTTKFKSKVNRLVIQFYGEITKMLIVKLCIPAYFSYNRLTDKTTVVYTA